MRDLRGRSEFAKSTFGAFSAVPTCLADSGLMLCVTSVVSMIIDLMSTTCRRGKSWTAFSHLPREHPHVTDTTHDDRAEEGVFLGNDLTTPNFWMYSFRAKKVMMLSDPKHWDHILPFMQSGDVPHRIALTDTDIRAIHTADGHEDGDVSIDVVTAHSQVASKLRVSGDLSDPSSTSISGEKVQELSVSNRVGNMIDDMLGGEQQVASSKPMLQDYKKFKHDKEVP
jgi:hypothetical protein